MNNDTPDTRPPVVFPDAPVRPNWDEVKAKGPVPLGYLVPERMTFAGALKTNCPPTAQVSIEGTIGWHISEFDEGQRVRDKKGVLHRALPLGRMLTTQSVGPLLHKLRKLSIFGCTCECPAGEKTVVLKHAEDCVHRMAVEAYVLVEELVRHSTSHDPDPEHEHLVNCVKDPARHMCSSCVQGHFDLCLYMTRTTDSTPV